MQAFDYAIGVFLEEGSVTGRYLNSRRRVQVCFDFNRIINSLSDQDLGCSVSPAAMQFRHGESLRVCGGSFV